MALTSITKRKSPCERKARQGKARQGKKGTGGEHACYCLQKVKIVFIFPTNYFAPDDVYKIVIVSLLL